MARSKSSRMMAARATFAGFPALTSSAYLALRSGLKRAAARAGMARAWPCAGPSAADEGAAGPASGLTRDRGKAGETCRAFILAWAELGHLDEHREGGCRTDAGDAGEDVEAELQSEIRVAQSRKGGADRRDLPVDPPKPLAGLALEQTGAQEFFPIERRGAVFHERPPGGV